MITGTTTASSLLLLASAAAAFTSSSSSISRQQPLHMTTTINEKDSKELYDPMGLYGENTPERMGDQIRALEPELDVKRPVLDPLGLYKNKKEASAEVDGDVVMSQAVPFLPRPVHLTGEMVGDAGFDPLNLAADGKLEFMREAELKHARIAMLAAAGWPLSELFDKPLAHFLHLSDSVLGAGDRAPSVLNGGLGKVSPIYWGVVLALAASIEAFSEIEGTESGDFGFDPLGLYPKDEEGQKRMQLSEVKNGRVAMMAITGFAIQEAFTKVAVVNETPFFFHPISEYLHMLTNSGYIN